MSSLTASDSFACSAQLSLEYLSENIWKLVLAAHLTKENSIQTAANTDSSEKLSCTTCIYPVQVFLEVITKQSEPSNSCMHRYKFNSLQDDVARRQLQKESGQRGSLRRDCLAILSDIFYILICIRIFRLPAKKDYANTKQSRRKRRQTAKAVDKVRQSKRGREWGRQTDRIFGFCTCQYEKRREANHPPPS